ncbi:DNA polymerase III subunit delta [Christensenellaceae bacterium OttesenSCG-928-M15]|nr:DNA polymerase III subunit delta [Christensenellaceae bacterium OttesenSCG-928-M15]
MEYRAFFDRLKQNDISGFFLFHGEEEYIKQAALNQLIDKIDPVARDLNLQQSRAPFAKAVLEACETLPFFSDRRLVIAHDMADAELKELLSAAGDLPFSTTLIAYIRGNCKKDILKLCDGRDVQFKEMTQTEALRFVRKRAKEAGKEIHENTARLLVEMVGVQAHGLLNELNKAVDYAGEQTEITPAMLKACVTVHPEYEYFEMLNQFLNGRKKEAFTAMRLTLKNDPGSAFMLAHSFSRQFKSMLSARVLLDDGVKEKDIPMRLNMKPWSARNALQGAKRMDADRLRQAVIAFSDIDYLQVSGRMNADRALEIAVLRYF